MTHPLAGKPALPRSSWTSRASSASTSASCPTGGARAARGLRHSGTAARSLNGSFTEAHVAAVVQATCEWRARKASTARSWSAGHARLVLLRELTALEVSRPTRRDPRAARERLHADTVHLARHSRPQVGRRPASPTASSSRPRTTRRRRGHQVQPAPRRPRTRRHRRDPDRANALLAAGTPTSSAMTMSARRRLPTSTSTTSSVPTWRTCATSSTPTRLRDANVRIGVDPLGGAGIGY